MIDLVVYMNTIIMNSVMNTMNTMNDELVELYWYGVSTLCYYIICGFILHAIYIDIRSNRRLVDGYRRETIYMYENNDYVICFIGCFIANLF